MTTASEGSPPDSPQIRLGRRLAELRDAAGLTQQALADVLNVSDATITRYEKGTRGMRSEDLFKIADALGVQPADFFLPRDDSPPLPAEPPTYLERLFYEEFNVGFTDVWRRLTPFERSVSAPVIALWQERARAVS